MKHPPSGRRCCPPALLVLAACSRRRRVRASPPRRGAARSAAAGAAPSAAAPARRVTIFGAASLKGVLDKAKAAYEAANPGTTLTISTDSSAALETQIEQGAPADVFLSADTTNPQKLVDKGLAAGAAVDLRRQQADGHRADGQPGGHRRRRPTSPRPASRSSPRATRCRSRSTPTSSSTTWPRCPATRPTSPPSTPRTSSSKEDNVKAVVAKVELGEGDAGIVYVTDAKASTKVTTVDVPDAANVPATYAGVVVKASPRTPPPRRPSSTGSPGPTARRSCRDFGFLPPPVIDALGSRGASAPRRSRRPAGRAARGVVGRARRSSPSPPCSRCSSACPSSRWSSGRVLDGSLAFASRSPAVLDALWLSLVTTAVSLVLTVAFGMPLAYRPGPTAGSAARAGRGHRRPADRPAAVGRRAGPAAGVRPARVAGRAVRRLRDLRSRSRDRRRPGPDVRRRAVLHPLGPDRDRRRRPRPRGRRARRRRLGAAGVPDDHLPLAARRWPPASS